MKKMMIKNWFNAIYVERGVKYPITLVDSVTLKKTSMVNYFH